MDTNKEQAHVKVSGRVQGVTFRDSARQKAEELGVAGWVKNLPDGQVEAVFEGPSEAVEEMVEWCQSGPSLADVQDLELEYGEPQGGFESFEVR